MIPDSPPSERRIHLSRLLSFSSENFIEVVEHLGASREALGVVCRRQCDAVDERPNTDRFLSTELAISEIDVVDDLRYGAKR